VIKVLTINSIADFILEIDFSNGETAHFDGENYLASRSGPLLEPLREAAYFRRCFIDAGAICWPNGLELSGERMLSLSRVMV